MMLFSLMLAAAAPQPADLRTFRDWTIGCDNGRQCMAVSLLPEDRDLRIGTSMLIERPAGPEGAPIVSIGHEEGTVTALSIDGVVQRRIRFTDREGRVRVDPRDSRALIAAMLRGSTLTLLDRRRTDIGAISLSGITAALLYMDEQQQRLNGVTALVRRGTRSASAAPAPPALPRIAEPVPAGGITPVAVPPRVARDMLADAGCNDSDRPLPAEGYRLDNRHYVAVATCGAGAYNTTSKVLIATRPDYADARPARFDLSMAIGPDETPGVLPGGYWDKAANRLKSFFKGRGLGDCGSMQSWGWDGTRFRLIEQRTMGECRGARDYIAVWRAQAVPVPR
jgi:hypothetical protein